MKLYATTTSERASKGQGGNKFSRTIITADEEMVIDILVEDYSEDEWRVRLDLLGEVYFRTTPKTKGKSQKGDNWICEECEYTTMWDNYQDGTPICPNCDIDLIHNK